MSTKENKVTITGVTSATLNVSSNASESTKFVVSAGVNVNNGVVSSFSNGQIQRKEDESFIGSFNSDASLNYFNVNTNGLGQEEIKEIVALVLVFIKDVLEDTTITEGLNV